MEMEFMLTEGGLRIPCKVCEPVSGNICRVVLGVHGIGGSTDDAIQSAIAEEMGLFHSVTFRFDFPAHGKSTVESDGFSLAACKDTLLAVAAEARRRYPGVEDLCVFASGFGAYVTLLVLEDLLELPGRVKLVVQTPSVRMHDTLLSMLMQMGVISTPEGMAAGEAFALTPEIREELTRTLILTVDSVLRLELPMQMATGSVAAGLLGQAALRKGVIARGGKAEYPKLYTWRVPKGWGRILGVTLLILYLLATLVPKSMNTMFYVFSGVFDRVFALQGIAALCYLMEERKKPAVFQKIVFMAGYFFLGGIAMTVGIFDQAIDFAHRREKLDKLENPFDPRHGA